MIEYEKDLNELKEQILKEGNVLVTKRDLLERFCEMDKEYNGEPWNLLQILSNIDVLVGEEPSKQKWIPVSERLPENETCVLTTIKIPNRIARVRSVWYDSGFIHNDNGDVWKATDMEVLAWIPLPKPYKTEKESEE